MTSAEYGRRVSAILGVERTPSIPRLPRVLYVIMRISHSSCQLRVFVIFSLPEMPKNQLRNIATGLRKAHIYAASNSVKRLERGVIRKRSTNDQIRDIFTADVVCTAFNLSLERLNSVFANIRKLLDQ